MEPHTTSQIHAPRRKRLKIATACLRCRRRKNAAAVREPGPSRFSDESRAAPRVPNASIQPFLEAAKDYAYPGLCSGLGASTAPETTNPSAIHPLQLDRSPSEPHGEDSMNGIIGDPARTREVYGSSSASSFIQQIQTAINFKFGIAHQITGEQKAIPRSRSPCPQTSLSNCEEPTLFLLPPKGLADGLIGAYWDNNWALVLSSTLGRPGMIPKWLFNSVPLPSMIDDEFFETQDIGSPIRPDGQPCIMAGAVKAMELYQILDEVLVDLYLNPNDSEDTKPLLKQCSQNVHAYASVLPRN
ncbi:C6 transcription factor [Aspergillus luchuensis]|uniref:C6 transcription factor n=1 Tax=Aspergillus kawachii TaxID=1069201 RepID=A0A146FGF0_ASPKA|nr:C6 transcription factor [Aspergillus luchuensis]